MQDTLKEELKIIRVENQKNLERFKYNIRSLEERIESKMKSQEEENSVCLQELECRILQHANEETGRIKVYVDNSVSQRLEGVKDEVRNIATQVDNKLQDLDRSVTDSQNKAGNLAERINENLAFRITIW
jgi:hypothetical protein